MAISYRKGNIDDLMIITELWDLMCRTENNSGENEYEEILIASREVLTNPEKAMFIAFDGDKAVGYSYAIIRHECFWSDKQGFVGSLDTIYVRPKYRRQGIAQSLVAMCEDWSRKKGCVEFTSNCDLDNEDSLAFHIGTGFKELHRLIHFSKEL
jgi:aminoglycoside 6'-N-acetyltransferase I